MVQVMTYVVVLVSVSCNAVAQLMLRSAMLNFNRSTAIPPVARALQLALSAELLSGLALFGLSILSWLYVLSRLPVSIAYPMASLGYIVAAALAHFVLREPVTWLQAAGILVICVGVALIAVANRGVS